MANESLVPAEYVERRILEIRAAKVILDSDLAGLYGVETRALNQAVRRNAARFPEDFVFQLTAEEYTRLRSQSVTSNIGRGGRRYLPFVFTEHGALKAANVLSSQRALEMSVLVVRAFVRLRGLLHSHAEMAEKLEQLEAKIGEHDGAIRSIVAALRQLMAPSAPDRHPIGFTAAGSTIGFCAVTG
jgi:hypothetical protein